MGTLYGYILSQNANVRITAIARSSYDAMKDGIEIRSDKLYASSKPVSHPSARVALTHIARNSGLIKAWKPYRLVRTADEANDRPYKYIICTTKCLPDLLPTASVLAPFLDSKYADSVDLEDGPTVVLLQNGVGIEHPLAMAYPNTPIISVVVWVGANLLPGGVVTHGKMEELIMGTFTGEGGAATGSAEPGESEYADPHGYGQQPDGADRLDEANRRLKTFADLVNNGGGCATVVDEIQPKR